MYVCMLTITYISDYVLGKDCPHYCQGAGYCDTSGTYICDYDYKVICDYYVGYCQCDSGATGSVCPISSADMPQTVISDFNAMINATFFPVTYGASLSNQCGVLSSGQSLVFKYVRICTCVIIDLISTLILL